MFFVNEKQLYISQDKTTSIMKNLKTLLYWE